MSMTDVGHFAETQARQLMDDALSAYKACKETAAYCVQEGGELADPDLLQPVHDCADVALMVTNLVTRASRFHRQAAALCADVAEACAEALNQRAALDDEQLRVTHAACVRLHQCCLELTGLADSPSSDQRDEALRETFPGSDPTPPPTEL
jgi:hypothetical protein